MLRQVPIVETQYDQDTYDTDDWKVTVTYLDGEIHDYVGLNAVREIGEVLQRQLREYISSSEDERGSPASP